MNETRVIEDRWSFKEASGERREVLVSLGWPYEVGPSHWQCEIRADGIFATSPRIIHGGGPVDTLINALEILKAVRDKSTFWDDDDGE